MHWLAAASRTAIVRWVGSAFRTTTVRGLRAVGLTACILAIVPAVAHDFQAGPIGVDRARADPAAAGQRETAAFVAISNSGKADVLTAVTCPDARSVELRAAIPTEGGTRMRTLGAIPVAAGTTVDFSREGYQLAFIALNRSFAAGERIAATLRFASGIELPVQFQVQDRGVDAGADEK